MRMNPLRFLVALCLVSACPAFAAAETGVPAQPVSVLFYPNEAQLMVKETLTPGPLEDGGQGVVIFLPAKARRDSFFASIAGEPVGASWMDTKDDGGFSRPLTTIPEREPDPQRRALLEKVDSLAMEKARREGVLRGLFARMQLWTGDPQSTPDNAPAPRAPKKAVTLETMDALDTQIGRRLPELSAAYAREQRDLEDLKIRLDKAEKKLREFDAAYRTQRVELLWAGDAGKPVSVQYAYTVPAGFTTEYRITAHPAKGSLTIDQTASLLQDSGFLWKNAEIVLSNAVRDTVLQPLPPRPWNISLQSAARPRSMAASMAVRKEAESADAMEEDLRVSASKSKLSRPTQEERATFRVWKLGKRALASARSLRIPLASDTYPTNFLYTVRPAMHPEGFLTAELQLSTPLELPRAPALFCVDGVSLDTRPFSFNGNKGTIFFGSDPQIAATLRDLQHSTGEEGIISKEQIMRWHWEFTVKNSRPHPVRVLVEDPMPQARDDDVTLTVLSQPKPQEGVTSREQGAVKVFRWNATLQPGETLSLDHQVRVAAPADKILLPGRGSR